MPSSGYSRTSMRVMHSFARRAAASDRAEVKAPVFLASLFDDSRAVSLGEHHHGRATGLEQGDIGIHSAGGCRSERAARIARRSLGRSCVIDDVVLEVARQIFPAVQPLLEFGVSNVSCHHHVPIENQTGGHRVLGQDGTDSIHGLIQVQDDPLFCDKAGSGRKRLGCLSRASRKYSILRDLGFYVSVGAAADPRRPARGAVSGKPDHPHIQAEVLAAELGADSEGLRHLQGFLFQVPVPESRSPLIPLSGS